MASSTPSRDMTEIVCQSPDCSDPHKYPKLLPCLHRYCKVYLASVIANKEKFKCSECNQDCNINKTKGMDGFETDLYMTNRLLLIKLQDSVVNNHQNQVCGNCSEKSTTPVYCFKCDNFLCQQCFQSHLTLETFLDHKPHILNLETMKKEKLTFENLSLFTVDPMCAYHETERAQSRCLKCNNVPICEICSTGTHQDHDQHNVVQLAMSERELLRAISSKFAKKNKVLHKILNLVKAKKLQIQCKLKENDTNRKRAKQELKIKFDDDMKTLKQKFDQESKEVKEQHDQIIAACQEELDDIKQKEQELSATEQENEPQGDLEIGKQLIERSENVKATYSSILDSKYFWSDTQCILYIRNAITSLIKEMEQTISQFGRKFKLNGTFMCDDPNCTYCKNHIVTSLNFTSYSNTITYNIEGFINCNTPFVIYLISCDICGKQYVGETTGPLKERIKQHTSAVRNSKEPSEIVEHFRAGNHTTNNMHVQGLQVVVDNNKETLLREEKKWMIKLGTMYPKGLNIK